MERLTVRAEDLMSGDHILIPRCVVQRVTLDKGKTHVGIVTEAGWPASFRRADLVGILRP